MTQQEFTNRYQFNIKTSKIGGGSFGTVYKVYDTVSQLEVSVEIMANCIKHKLKSIEINRSINIFLLH